MTVAQHGPYMTYAELYDDYINMKAEIIKEHGPPVYTDCSDIEKTLDFGGDPNVEIPAGIHSCVMPWEHTASYQYGFVTLKLVESGVMAAVMKTQDKIIREYNLHSILWEVPNAASHGLLQTSIQKSRFQQVVPVRIEICYLILKKTDPSHDFKNSLHLPVLPPPVSFGGLRHFLQRVGGQGYGRRYDPSSAQRQSGESPAGGDRHPGEKAALWPGRHALQPQPERSEDRYGQSGNHRPLRPSGRGGVSTRREESESGTGPGRICLVVPQVQRRSDDWGIGGRGAPSTAGAVGRTESDSALGVEEGAEKRKTP